MVHRLVSAHLKLMFLLVAITAAIPVSSGLSILFLAVTRLRPDGYVASMASVLMGVSLIWFFLKCVQDSLRSQAVKNVETKVSLIVNFKYLTFGILNLLLMSISAFDVMKVNFSSANDGPNHMEILRGISASNVIRLHPLLVTQDGNRIETHSPYPLGSHLLTSQLGRLIDVDPRIVYQCFAVFFVAIGFPVAIGFISWVASERSTDWFLIGTVIGICGKPNEKYLQNPTLMAVAAAFIVGAFVYLIIDKVLAAAVLNFSAFSLLVVHPSGLASCYLVYFLIGGRLKAKVYMLGLIGVSIFALTTSRLLETKGYFNTWININTNPIKEQYVNSIIKRGVRFMMDYIAGLGNSNVLLGCACVLVIGCFITNFENRNIFFPLLPVLILLVSSGFSGIPGLGPIFAFFTFPWYGSPQRFVMNWTAAIAIIISKYGVIFEDEKSKC